MDTCVWRIPTLLGLMAAFALVLFAAGVLGSDVTRRRPSTGLGVGTGVVLVLLAFAAAIAARATAANIARSLDVNLRYVAPGLLGYLAPVVFAAFAFAVGNRILKGAWG